ncbi:MAG: hypothetical protein BA872_03180 [Desulfobacterales bacterium C00003060]|nr:MAG: hypothetical protein BA872_03180 [Desulfobacterales bacterium C00003060]
MKKLSSQETKRLLEELRALQKPSTKLTKEDYRNLAAADKNREVFQVKRAFEKLRESLVAKCRRTGSLCKFLPYQLIPLHISTGIEYQPKEHFALLVERYRGQQRWLWATSKKKRAQNNLRRLARVDDTKHLVTIPKKCIDNIDFSRMKDGVRTVNTEQDYDTLLESSRRRVPEKETFLAAHWKFYYVPHGSDPEGPERFWGSVPDRILAKTVDLVSR